MEYTSNDEFAKPGAYVYAVQIVSDLGQCDLCVLDNYADAEDRYFRAFGAVSQKTTVEDAGGKRVRLIGCTIYEVPAKQRNFARQLIAANQVRRLLDSDDVYCGKPIVIEGLFRKFN